HDSMGMLSRAEAAAQAAGIAMIPAVELSTMDHETGRKVHLLVYWPKNMQPLTPIFRRMARLRREAGERMIERVQALYPVRREDILRYADKSSTIFRVHLLRALLEMGYDATIYGPLYRELFADPGGSCLEPVDYTDLNEAAEAARRSGGAVVLAHPSVYDSFDAAHRLGRAGLLDGLELCYPRRDPETREAHETILRAYELIPTGGTDYHGFYTSLPRPIGSCTTGEYELGQLHKLSL
ncbi:MAG: PHP domain-containing protein, partial [Oscillospiraceae bacterium]